MIIISNVNLSLDTNFTDLKPIAAKELRTNIGNIVSASLYRRSVDARHKNNVRFCCSILVEISNEERYYALKNVQKYTEEKYIWQRAQRNVDTRPIIVGFGPAGMFAALFLARAGLRPIVIERGKCAEERKRDINSFFNGGTLERNSNVQFGEGGAGTFSDGKLNTGIKDVRCRTVLKEFVKFGAPSQILINAKPHIGTDILIEIVSSIRKEIISLGGEVLFSHTLDSITVENGVLKNVTANNKTFPCSHLILACGHSARDTFEMLKENDIAMERKPFSMGVRIEHLQSDINRALYGDFAEHKALGAADYKLAVHLKSGRGVYTFCMCPGGEVINASSEPDGITVNGMSNSKRDGVNANSALLVGINPEDIKGDDILGGCYLQREIENKAFKIAGGAVPIMTVGEFLNNNEQNGGVVTPSVKPSTVHADFGGIFPEFIISSLKEALPLFDKKISGFANSNAILTAPETRSSSPIRILRNEDLQSLSAKGIYPCGEGAGYAGGIMSAAVDGLKVGEAVLREVNQEQ